jgi:hypothetical protein
MEILDIDPDLTDPANTLLQSRLTDLFRRNINWGLIS